MFVTAKDPDSAEQLAKSAVPYRIIVQNVSLAEKSDCSDHQQATANE
jgi:hypothetical protein